MGKHGTCTGWGTAFGQQEPRHYSREQRAGEGLTLGVASLLPEGPPPKLYLTKDPAACESSHCGSGTNCL